MADLEGFLQEIITSNPHLGLQLQTMVDAIRSVAASGGLGVLQKLPAPATLAAVNVAWNKAGVYQITHQTSQAPNQQASYFSEIDTSPSFPAPFVIFHGPSRSTEPKVLPNGTYYIRGFHQYPGSLPSTPVNYGGSTPAPIVIAGGSDLTLLPSTGSGTSPENGQRGGTGFGISQVQPPNSQLTLASIPSSGGGGGGGGGTSFSVITTGDNTQADMTVDTGAKLGFAGSGVVNASEINGVPFNNTDPPLGTIPIAQGDGTATWADPLVQGIEPVGTAVSGINPVLVGAEDSSSNLANLNLDSSGNLKVNVAAGGGGNSAAGPTGSAVPADADYVGFNSSGNLVGVSSSNPLPIAGAVTQGTAADLNATVVGTGTFVVQDSNDMTGTVPGTAPSKTGVVGGIYNSSAPSPTTGQTLPVQLDSSGNLKVNVAAGSSGNAAASATGSAVPADAGYTGFNSGGDLVGVSSANPLPVTVSGSSSANPAAGATGSPVPTDAGYTGFADGSGNLVGVSAAAPMPTIATFASGSAVKLLDSGGTNEASISAGGALKVDGSAVTQPVSGTVTAKIEGNTGATIDAAPGSAIPTNAVMVGGTDGTDLRAVLTNLEGSLLTNPASTIGSNFLGTTTGTDCIWTVPSGKRWRIISLSCLFQPDATVANRGIGVIWQDASSHTAGIAGYSALVTASAPTFFTAASGVVPQNNTFDALPNINLALPENLILGPGMVIRTYSTGLDASDKFSGPTLLYEQWSDT